MESKLREVLKENYRVLKRFLSANFHQDIDIEHDLNNELNLIDVVLKNTFSNPKRNLDELYKALEDFLDSQVSEEEKSEFVTKNVDIILYGLDPIEFIYYIFLKLKMEIWIRDNF